MRWARATRLQTSTELMAYSIHLNSKNAESSQQQKWSAEDSSSALCRSRLAAGRELVRPAEPSGPRKLPPTADIDYPHQKKGPAAPTIRKHSCSLLADGLLVSTSRLQAVHHATR